MTRKKRRKQTGRRHRQRALRRRREKLRRKRSESQTVAVEPAADEKPVQDDPPASVPTATADPATTDKPQQTKEQRRQQQEQRRQQQKERRQRRKQLEQAKKRKQQTPVAKAPTADDAESAGELQPDTSPRRSGRPPKPKLKDSDLSGFKYFDELAPRFETLHELGCQRDKAGNRTLHYDQFCMGMLLALFNPIVNSLGGLDQATQFSRIRERLGVERMSVSSLSEAARLFEAEALIPIIQDLGKDLEPLSKDPRLAEVRHTLTLVDGTLLNALPDILQAVTLKEQKGSALVKWRLHAQFEVEKYVPTRIDVTPNGGGKRDERAVMESTVEAGRCYVMDRGYAKFTLFNKIHVASNYVCRLRDNSAYQVLEERPLSQADRAAGVIRDAIVELGATSKKDARPDHKIRLVIVQTEPHVKRGKYKGGSTGPASDGQIRIATDLLDVPAEIIALIYRYRWSIELFFRFFKQLLGCRHLFFHNENGIKLQAYLAIIATMLFSLWTGRKPNKRTFETICWYFLGLVTDEELQQHLEGLPAEELPYRNKQAA
jgi:hypothetical protein